VTLNGRKKQGGPPKGPPAGAPALNAAQLQVAGMITGLVAALSSTAPAPEVIQKIAVRALVEQEALGRVLEDAADPVKRAAHPEWGVKVAHTASGAEGVIRVPKDLSHCTSIDQIMHHAMIVALVTNPTPRALLLAHGFTVEFFQAVATPPKPPKPRLVSV
jgi:hypothetical protein